MHQRQRPCGHVRNDPIGGALVVAGELDLRNPEVRVNQPIRCGMRTPTTVAFESLAAGARRLGCLARETGLRILRASPRRLFAVAASIGVEESILRTTREGPVAFIVDSTHGGNRGKVGRLSTWAAREHTMSR